MVLPQLCGEQQKDIPKVLRCCPEYVCLRLH
jgi:hypothetical protein